MVSGIRNLGAALLGPLLWVSLKAVIQLSPGWGSSICLTTEGPAPNWTWLWVEFSSSRAVGMRASDLRWLLARGYPQYLAKGPLQYGCRLYPSQQARASASRLEVTIVSNLVMGVKSHHHCHILLVRSKS